MIVISLRAALPIILLMLFTPTGITPLQSTYSPLFDGDEAFIYLTDQCDFGPRPPGSDNLSLCREYIVDSLELQGWDVTLQNFSYRNVDCSNIIATWPVQNDSIIVLGAHYDTRLYADQEHYAENRTLPVLGANDAASGVAALLELAKVLPESARSYLEMVFFDAEDSGNIDGWEWIVGSTYYVNQLTTEKQDTISSMVLLDMIGDVNLRIPRERSSTDSLQDEIWTIAADLGYDDVFLDVSGSSILDDHAPFLSAGIPAVDLIHTPFPWTWHTQYDIPDNCSPDSLEVVGQVIEIFIIETTTSGSTFTPDPIFDFAILFVVATAGILIAVVIYYKRK